MKSQAYFCSMVVLPTVVTGPGAYVTRCGETVTVDVASTRHEFGCHGTYPGNIRESWHKSGRLFASRETANDIVKPAQT